MEDQVLCRLVSAVAVWTGGGVLAHDPVKIAGGDSLPGVELAAKRALANCCCHLANTNEE